MLFLNYRNHLKQPPKSMFRLDATTVYCKHEPRPHLKNIHDSIQTAETTSFNYDVTLDWQWKKNWIFSLAYCMCPNDHYIMALFWWFSTETYTGMALHAGTQDKRPSSYHTHHSDRSLNHLHPEAGNKQIRYLKHSAVGAYWWISGLSVISCKYDVLGVNPESKLSLCLVSLYYKLPH